MSSHITNGQPGEVALERYDRVGVSVTRWPDDPLALRVSLGQVRGPGAGGAVDAYCVFRGDREKAIALLKRALTALEGGPGL